MKLNDIENAVLLWGCVGEEAFDEVIPPGALIVVPEQRHFLHGLKHTVPLVQKRGARFVYCPDPALGLLFFQGRIEKSVIAYRQKLKEGVRAWSGGLYVALLSRFHGRPVAFTASSQECGEVCDKDASTIEGENFVLAENIDCSIIEAQDEFISWEEVR
jgi:hypothetical protein